MANEITTHIRFQCANGDFKPKVDDGPIQTDQDNPGGTGLTQTFDSDSAEALNVGGVTVPGECYLRNLSDTNYLDFGPDSSGMVPTGRLYPGKDAKIPLHPDVTLKFQAEADGTSTGTAQLYYVLLEK